jgi:hypothetical protein
VASIFDGMAGVLNDVFGAPVMVFPVAGGMLTGNAIFRDTPISVATEDGHSLLVTSPTLRMQRPDADQIAAGDEIQPDGDARRFRVLNRLASGSPAADAFVVFELELI